jgi:hypothetical protein
MTPDQFRNDTASRTELFAAINCKAFREAVGILTRLRQANEAKLEVVNCLAGDAIASVRINSQRVGMEGFINDLYALCEPPVLVPEDDKATYQQDEAASKLEQF